MKRILLGMLCLAGLLAANGTAYASARIVYEPGESDNVQSVLIADTGLMTGEQAYQLKHYLCSIKQEGVRCINGKFVDSGDPT